MLGGTYVRAAHKDSELQPRRARDWEEGQLRPGKDTAPSVLHNPHGQAGIASKVPRDVGWVRYGHLLGYRHGPVGHPLPVRCRGSVVPLPSVTVTPYGTQGGFSEGSKMFKKGSKMIFFKN